ncbi:MAG: hypothetical protein ACRDJI_01055 [Actinomycetota bacterium]
MSRVTRGLRRALALRPLSREDSPRAHNMAEGLASDLGIDPPSLHLIPAGEPNALVFLGSAPSVALAGSLLETFARTELEAVVAHCLIRFKETNVRRAMVAVWWGRRGHRFAPEVGREDDIRTCALTRYPPALAAALRKAVVRDERFGPLWFVGAGPPHRSAVERALDVLDL